MLLLSLMLLAQPHTAASTYSSCMQGGIPGMTVAELDAYCRAKYPPIGGPTRKVSSSVADCIAGGVPGVLVKDLAWVCEMQAAGQK